MVVKPEDLEKKIEIEYSISKKSKLIQTEHWIDEYLLKYYDRNPINVEIESMEKKEYWAIVKKLAKKYEQAGWKVSYRWEKGKPMDNDFGDFSEYPGWRIEFRY